MLILSCILCFSYIKPQLPVCCYCRGTVVSYVFPTSNHNSFARLTDKTRVVSYVFPTSNHNYLRVHGFRHLLYLMFFLHQTTTRAEKQTRQISCILCFSYIKPQHLRMAGQAGLSCILCFSYIKPQPQRDIASEWFSCILCFSYIKPQPYCIVGKNIGVVSYVFPTSNHNAALDINPERRLYLMFFLHQTTTRAVKPIQRMLLYLMFFLHQTTTKVLFRTA